MATHLSVGGTGDMVCWLPWPQLQGQDPDAMATIMHVCLFSVGARSVCLSWLLLLAVWTSSNDHRYDLGFVCT